MPFSVAFWRQVESIGRFRVCQVESAVSWRCARHQVVGAAAVITAPALGRGSWFGDRSKHGSRSSREGPVASSRCSPNRGKVDADRSDLTVHRRDRVVFQDGTPPDKEDVIGPFVRLTALSVGPSAVRYPTGPRPEVVPCWMPNRVGRLDALRRGAGIGRSNRLGVPIHDG